MKSFLKYFIIGLVIQIVVVIPIIFLGIGDFVLIPYLIPYEVLGVIFPTSKQIGEGLTSLIILLFIPAVFYSIVFALTMCIIKRPKKIS